MPDVEPSFKVFAMSALAGRLSDFDREMYRARADESPAAVHDLRVAARRTLYALDCLHNVTEGPDAARVHKRLKAVLAAGGHVRDLDIALELAEEAGVRSDALLVSTLRTQREQARQALSDVLERHRYCEFADKWILRLGLRDE